MKALHMVLDAIDELKPHHPPKASIEGSIAPSIKSGLMEYVIAVVIFLYWSTIELIVLFLHDAAKMWYKKEGVSWTSHPMVT